MNERVVSKWICIGYGTTRSYSERNKKDNYQTIGKIYEVTTNRSSPGGQYHESSHFTGDDGNTYVFYKGDGGFIPIEEWRERQLNKIL